MQPKQLRAGLTPCLGADDPVAPHERHRGGHEPAQCCGHSWVSPARACGTVQRSTGKEHTCRVLEERESYEQRHEGRVAQYPAGQLLLKGREPRRQPVGCRALRHCGCLSCAAFCRLWVWLCSSRAPQRLLCVATAAAGAPDRGRAACISALACAQAELQLEPGRQAQGVQQLCKKARALAARRYKLSPRGGAGPGRHRARLSAAQSARGLLQPALSFCAPVLGSLLRLCKPA